MPQDKWVAYRSRMTQRVIPKNDTERYWFIQSDLQELANMLESSDTRIDGLEEQSRKQDASRQFKLTTRLVGLGIAVQVLLHYLPSFK